jgi:L-amino acid N-acyltransferase YncA
VTGDPTRTENELVLRAGEVVTVRFAGPGDEPLLRAFLAGLCLDARRLRFFTAGMDVEGMARWFAARSQRRIGLIALDGGGAIVGHALCGETGPGCAEVGVEVADRLHGHGLGTILLTRLARAAEERGIATFQARVLPENRAMLDVFRDGFAAEIRLGESEDRVAFPTAAWRTALERYGNAAAPTPSQRSPSSSPRSSA